ncbi:MAG: hypothetical protein AB1411_08200 [Nitrospirota bacterium]
MAAQVSVSGLIEITETLVRLYVFLAQYLDRCRDEGLRRSFPEQELQHHLSTTKTKLLAILSVNRIVKGKVEYECERILSLGAACLKDGARSAALLGDVEDARAVLQNKTIALSDLLAVFRAL